ncbi:DUF6521 family protein [Bacillus thuringiensis]|nr:DUF6521 family protein [Bacillus thuringiensis]
MIGRIGTKIMSKQDVNNQFEKVIEARHGQNNDTFSLYNNEFIGSLSVFNVLKFMKEPTAAKILLVLPLVFHNDLVSFLNNGKTKVRSIEELIIKKPEFVSNFNSRFYSLIRVSINSILILQKMKLINIGEDGIINLVDEQKELLPSYDKKSIGNRALNIIKSSQVIADILDEKVEKIYLQLKVKL